MALSQSSKYEVEDRNTLYFNKFKYRATFKVHGASRTRYIKDINEYRVRLDEAMKTDRRYGYDNALNLIDLGEISELIDFRDKCQLAKTATYTVDYHSNVKVYTNDIAVLDQAMALGFANFTIKEANPCVPLGTMYFKNKPKYTHRVYLRSRNVDEDFKDKMRSFLDNHPMIIPCGSLKRWITDHSNRFWWNRATQTSHFMDFDGEAQYMIILMVFGDITGKYYELHQRP